jgi:MFS family permease
MTNFALTIWAFEEAGKAAALAGIQAAFILPFLIVSPMAGVMVDRHNRRPVARSQQDAKPALAEGLAPDLEDAAVPA